MANLAKEERSVGDERDASSSFRVKSRRHPCAASNPPRRVGGRVRPVPLRRPRGSRRAGRDAVSRRPRGGHDGDRPRSSRRADVPSLYPNREGSPLGTAHAEAGFRADATALRTGSRRCRAILGARRPSRRCDGALSPVVRDSGLRRRRPRRAPRHEPSCDHLPRRHDRALRAGRGAALRPVRGGARRTPCGAAGDRPPAGRCRDLDRLRAAGDGGRRPRGGGGDGRGLRAGWTDAGVAPAIPHRRGDRRRARPPARRRPARLGGTVRLPRRGADPGPAARVLGDLRLVVACRPAGSRRRVAGRARRTRAGAAWRRSPLPTGGCPAAPRRGRRLTSADGRAGRCGRRRSRAPPPSSRPTAPGDRRRRRWPAPARHCERRG